MYVLYPERSLAIEENTTPMSDIIKVKQKSSYKVISSVPVSLLGFICAWGKIYLLNSPLYQCLRSPPPPLPMVETVSPTAFYVFVAFN